MKHEALLRSTLGLATTTLALSMAADADAKPYKGGEIFSSQAYQYGRMEVRMRMARGSGILSTFFTYKDGSEIEGTFWEEIDIEVFGKDDATGWQSNIITGTGVRTRSEQVHTGAFSLADDYHTYALEWTPAYVAWELDGTVVRRTEGGQVPDLTSPQTLRFNVWAANIADWVGPFDDTVLPQYQFVSWIRYFAYEGGQFVLEWTDDFDTFDTARWGRADWTFAENLTDFDPNNALVRDGTLVLALTREGQTGFDGAIPFDDGGNTGGAGGTASTGDAGSGSGGSATGEGGGAGAVTASGGGGIGGAAPGSSGASNGSGGGGITASNGGSTVGTAGGGINGSNGGATVGTGGVASVIGGAAPTSSGTAGVGTNAIGTGNAGETSAVPPVATAGSASLASAPGTGAKGCSVRTSPRQPRGGMAVLMLCVGLASLSRRRVRLKRHALP